MVYDERGLVRISYSTIWLILPPQWLKMTQIHQIMCGWKICTQDVTYQDSLNHFRNQRLIYKNNNDNSLTWLSVGQLNAEIISYIYSDVVLTDKEPIYTRSKDAAFSSMCDFTDKYTNLRKWSCVLNCCSECTDVFIPDVKLIVRKMWTFH